MRKLAPTDDDATEAEVLTPAEQRALRERYAQPSSPAPAVPLDPFAAAWDIRWPPIRVEDVPELNDPEVIAKVRQAQAMLREHRKRKRGEAAQRKAARYERAGLEVPESVKRKLPPPPKPDPIDAAIERAYEREAQLAARTPEQQWTPAMRAAVNRTRERKDRTT